MAFYVLAHYHQINVRISDTDTCQVSINIRQSHSHRFIIRLMRNELLYPSFPVNLSASYYPCIRLTVNGTVCLSDMPDYLYSICRHHVFCSADSSVIAIRIVTCNLFNLCNPYLYTPFSITYITNQTINNITITTAIQDQYRA